MKANLDEDGILILKPETRCESGWIKYWNAHFYELDVKTYVNADTVEIVLDGKETGYPVDSDVVLFWERDKMEGES